MLLAELRSPFQFGVLLVTDSASTDPIPSWTTPDEQVTSTRSALVMRVLHADEGECTVKVWDDDKDVSGRLAYSGSIEVPSGVLRISDALGSVASELALDPGLYAIEIFADAAVEATSVHVVLRRQ